MMNNPWAQMQPQQQMQQQRPQQDPGQMQRMLDLRKAMAYPGFQEARTNKIPFTPDARVQDVPESKTMQPGTYDQFKQQGQQQGQQPMLGQQQAPQQSAWNQMTMM